MGEVAEAAAAAKTSREVVGVDGGGADPVWRGTTAG